MNNQNGSIAVITSILLVVFLGFVALSVDVGYLLASKNELQNAADAGALAGARELYFEDGAGYGVNPGCNKVAYDTAIQNFVAKGNIEINGGLTNLITDDIRRGHWSFNEGDNTEERKFTHSDKTTVELWEGGKIRTKADLDDDRTFVNAVEVTVRRETNPITLFFAKIFDQSDAKMSATAVAYIGFAGTFFPADFDAPVALCVERLALDPLKPLEYTCGYAVWYEAAETAMWTNFLQVEEEGDACTSGNDKNVAAVLNGNLMDLTTGLDMGVINGGTSNHTELKAIWEAKSFVTDDQGINEPDARKIVSLALPVIRCFDKDDGKEENKCAELVGGVTVELLWMTDQAAIQEQGAYGEVPKKLYDLNGDIAFESDEALGEDRWKKFAETFDMLDDEEPVELAKDQMYFRASCETSLDPLGGPGGENFGLLSKTPVLVD